MNLEKISSATVDYIDVDYDSHYAIQWKRGHSARLMNTQHRLAPDGKSPLTVTKIAESAGAVADVRISTGCPVTYNDPELTAMMLPSLKAAAGGENVKLIKAITGAEDFSFFQQQIPGLYFFLGGMPKVNIGKIVQITMQYDRLNKLDSPRTIEPAQNAQNVVWLSEKSILQELGKLF